ncbi:MAG: hypothetical protein IJR03_06070 [Bacteroidales bacterium]|nr:hypothetical protein [Bacteroidales bacterium]
MSNRLKHIIFFFGVLFSFFSCNDEFDEWGYVNMYIDPESTEYFDLNTGRRGWVYLHGGNRGILVVRNAGYENTTDAFFAFERSCVAKGCKGTVEMDESNVLIVCPDCKSTFLTYEGLPVSGKAKRALYAYRTFYDGIYLYIKN